MIDFIKALRAIECDFDNEGQGGNASYQDELYGEVEFSWYANKSKIMIHWWDTEPICLCGNGFAHNDCDCEWTWFQDTEPIEKTFTKAQALKINQPALF